MKRLLGLLSLLLVACGGEETKNTTKNEDSIAVVQPSEEFLIWCNEHHIPDSYIYGETVFLNDIPLASAFEKCHEVFGQFDRMYITRNSSENEKTEEDETEEEDEENEDEAEEEEEMITEEEKTISGTDEEDESEENSDDEDDDDDNEKDEPKQTPSLYHYCYGENEILTLEKTPSVFSGFIIRESSKFKVTIKKCGEIIYSLPSVGEKLNEDSLMKAIPCAKSYKRAKNTEGNVYVISLASLECTETLCIYCDKDNEIEYIETELYSE